MYFCQGVIYPKNTTPSLAAVGMDGLSYIHQEMCTFIYSIKNDYHGIVGMNVFKLLGPEFHEVCVCTEMLVISTRKY